MIEVRLLDKKKELDEVNKFLPAQVSSDELPGHTFCAVNDGEIVAIAGLRLAEGPMCLIDSMATNQKCEGFERYAAINALTKTILEKAKELGFKVIIATTKEETIEKIAIKHGFGHTDQIVIAKEL
jgi:N-acetylglutamate synthase-like GNAT family acetyltransferase